MRQEIIDVLIESGPWKGLSALEIGDGDFSVCLSTREPALGFLAPYNGVKIQFLKSQTSWIAGLAFITWHRVYDEEALAIKRTIYRKLALFWVKKGRQLK